MTYVNKKNGSVNTYQKLTSQKNSDVYLSHIIVTPFSCERITTFKYMLR